MTDLFERHLGLLRRRDGTLADQVAEASAADLTIEPAKDEPASTGMVVTGDSGAGSDVAGSTRRVTLASRRRPLSEAEKLADQADLKKHAVVVVMGLGLGHHVRLLAERTAGRALLVVFEPDLPLLRAVLERVDCTDWLDRSHVLLLGGDLDADQIGPRLSRSLEGAGGYVAQGVQLLTHPPARQMHPATLERFGKAMTEFVAYCRTNVATTLAQSVVTCRNLVRNIGRYAAGPTINPFADAASGKPAVLVAAGPSLAKNVHLLSRPGMRDRVVIIAAQTVLKPLLARGVRPHFVTALDYHEISRRFYEGLPDLPDVTLIAEPKANQAILDHYPGPVAICRSPFLDLLLGDAARPVDALPAGTTVAHLSFYFAQYLGCDPIILTGQDLGFSDGLYYCPGTAIHDVWGPELGAFNTLEMMEWKRVARHRAHLQKREDIHGRPIYSDEQMLTYLRQFERDFANAPQRIIDATEGGLPKSGTETLPLADALPEPAGGDERGMPTVPRSLDRDRLKQAAHHLAARREQVQTLRTLTVRTQPVLRKMKQQQRDKRKMNRLFEELEALKRQVADHDDAFRLVNELNQIGAFHRAKSDRQIEVRADTDPYERQAAQLDRDLINMDWLIDACDEVLTMFDEAAARVAKQIEALESERSEPPVAAPVGAQREGAA